MALRPCLTMQGSGPEPGPTQGATRAAWGLHSSPPDPLLCARRAPLGPFLRTPRPAAPGPLPLRSSAPARRARRRFAGPFRRFAPSGLSALPGPAPRGFPPGSPARGPARGPSPASVPARCRRCPGLALAALRAPCSVALASSRARPLGFASARRGPPCPVRFAASGAAGSRPGGLRSPPGRLSRPPAPGALSARPRLRGLAGGSVAAFPGWGGFSPAPPRPAAPAGGSGGREACSGGLRAPAGVPLFAALSGGSPGARGAPGAPFSARLTVRKL